ncbi:phage major capsid protein [Bacillus pseudomycoides]|nr:phage major capsid protein [Bacillus pseudomycoides]
MKMELRVNQTNIEANEDGSMTVNGYVNKTEQFSEMLGRNEKFKEKISRGAFKRAIGKAKEIHFLAEHDSEKILASTRNASLQLSEDENGLYMSATITPTSWGKDYYELIKSGILKNMSFGFRSIKDSWKKNIQGYFERTINDLELFEVSVVRDPAYSQSSISARGIDVVEDIEIPTDVKKKIVRNIQEMSRKALIELRNDLLEQLQSYETRGLTEEQKCKRLQNEIRDVEIQLKKIDKKEARNMLEFLNPNDTNVEVEQRGFEAFLRGQHNTEEYRAVTTGTVPGNLAIPNTISDEIVKKLKETGQLFARTKIFGTTTGTLEVLREKTLGEAGFIGEMKNINPLDYEMDKVKLEQKRVGTAIELSKQMINDAGFDINTYVMELLARRIAITIDKHILTGDITQDSFEGILKATLPTECNLTTITGSLSIDDLLDMYNSMNPQLVQNAVWIMNRQTFSVISKLKDATGQYLVTSIKDAEAHYKLMGLDIVISADMPDVAAGNKAVVLANMSEAVAVMVKKGLNLLKIDTDTTQGLRGSALFIGDIYMDSKVLNTQALRVLTIK